ncbi:MAG: M16 family metallopeptidase [Planctomycetota bacterium]|jgi:zinc protease
MFNTMEYKRLRFGLLTISVMVMLIASTGCQQNIRSIKAARFNYEHIELDNGLDVITLEDFSCPIVAVQLWYHVGSKDEQPDRQGFAHMFEHMMFRGTDRLGPTDHFGYIRRVGGTTNGYTSFDKTVYLETLPADQLELALWLEAERMAFLKIDQEAFDTERNVVEEERRRGLNQPYGTLVEDLVAEIFKVHPYRWTPIGKIPHLRAAQVQELRDFWLKYYVPNNATLIIVGAVTHKEAQKQAKQYFGWLPRYDDPPKVTLREPISKQARTVTIKQENAPAPGVGVAYRTVALNDKDTVAFDLAAEILGGGNSSRLYRELVAQKQLAVQVQAISYSLEQEGLFGAGVAMSPFGSDANAVLEIIAGHIEKLRAEPITERELSKAKNQMLRQMVTENLRIDSKARLLGTAAVMMDDVERVNQAIEEIQSVTADDILRVSNEYLLPECALKIKVERNLLGTLKGAIGQKPKEDVPVTAEPEMIAPKPGRKGLVRAKHFPTEPPFAKVKSSRLTPQYSSTKLPNGLKVMVVPNHEVPFVSVRLGMMAGAWTEDKPGTAAMAMNMLTKGTSKHTEGELADELETYAISLSGSGGMDTSSISMGALTEHLERAMLLMGEVTLMPTFPEEEFGKLRKQVLTSLTISSEEPSYLAARQFRRALYGEHFYSRTATGEIQDVNALNIDDLKQWWQRLSRPDMAVLIFAGDIHKDKAFELAGKAFGHWKSPGSAPIMPQVKLAERKKTQIYLVDRPGSVQSQIRIGQFGITRHDNGYFVSRLVNSYFGSGFNSRLNETVRVEKGLTYGIWGGYVAKRFAGDFTISTFSKPETTAQAVQAVLDEIERLCNEQPDTEELENSRTYILGSFVRQREIPQQIAQDLWLIESQQLGSDYLDRLLDGIVKTKQNDCTALTKDSIDPEKLVIVVVGEAEKIKEDLEKIAPVTIVTSQ